LKSTLNISGAAILGVHSLALLSRREGPVPAAHIAEDLGESVHHLHKVLSRLDKEGVITSRRGPEGGYVLTADPAQITLLWVIELFDEAFGKATCLLPTPSCVGHDDCEMQILNAKVTSLLRESLGQMTILQTGWSRSQTPA
jgi:Rrf2 family protein